MSKKIDLTNQKFGHWTVLSYDKDSKWICQCECGTIRSVHSTSLRKGTSTSCGCVKAIKARENNGKFVDETGNRYGRLVVIQKDEKLSAQKHRAYWICKCDCGNYKTVSSKCLRSNKTNSCGCILSIGEEKIARYLQSHKILYTLQYNFPNTLYRYDFALLNEDNSIKSLIEYNGIQHYKYNEHTTGWNNKQNYILTCQRDKHKKQLAQEKNIPLYIIPYWNQNDIDKILNDIIKGVAKNEATAPDIEEAQELEETN